MKLSVISLFRDSASYLHDTFANLESLELQHEVDYYFYENDSADDTAAQLRTWMTDRSGLLVSEQLGRPRFSQTTEPARLAAMADYRNRILEKARTSRSEWTLLLDSDVSFTSSAIATLLTHADASVAMLTPRVEYNVACHMCSPGCGQRAYYDTFALRDRGNRRGQSFSCNPFWESDDRDAWAAGHPVEVHCAFAGAALIRTPVLHQCAWASTGDCEHVPFANQVRAHGRILAVPSARVETTAAPIAPSAAFLRMQHDLMRNPLLRQFWTSRNWGTLA